MQEIEALAEADARRWNRQARLTAWVLPYLPEFIATGVAVGIAAVFGKDVELPELPTYDKLIESWPDYFRDEDEEPDGER